MIIFKCIAIFLVFFIYSLLGLAVITPGPKRWFNILCILFWPIYLIAIIICIPLYLIWEAASPESKEDKSADTPDRKSYLGYGEK